MEKEQLLFFFRKPFDAPRTRNGFSQAAYSGKALFNFDLL